MDVKCISRYQLFADRKPGVAIALDYILYTVPVSHALWRNRAVVRGGTKRTASVVRGLRPARFDSSSRGEKSYDDLVLLNRRTHRDPCSRVAGLDIHRWDPRPNCMNTHPAAESSDYSAESGLPSNSIQVSHRAAVLTNSSEDLAVEMPGILASEKTAGKPRDFHRRWCKYTSTSNAPFEFRGRITGCDCHKGGRNRCDRGAQDDWMLLRQHHQKIVQVASDGRARCISDLP